MPFQAPPPVFKLIFALFLPIFAFYSCETEDKEPLKTYPVVLKSGAEPTILEIPYFSFTDQNGEIVTNQTFDNKIYLADFFFTSCPTICPKVKAQMKRVYDAFASEPRLVLLSHTIDPKRDSVARLRNYAQKIGVNDAKRWHLVTGSKDSIYNIARYYNSVAVEDQTAPGGFDHSGYVVLIDKKRHIRAIARGTEAEDMDRMMKDIKKLLKE